MENIRSYEDMENYVRNQIENSWDFVDKDPWGFIIMVVGIQGKHKRYISSCLWLAGDNAEEETVRKAVLEAESLFEITYEDAVSMQYSMDLEEAEMSDRFFARVRDNEDDFWEPEYMAAMDDPETEDNIKKLAADLWKQWKENELDE
jgi:hypothetical protein